MLTYAGAPDFQINIDGPKGIKKRLEKKTLSSKQRCYRLYADVC
jgi:hypothetical protein